MPCTAVCPGSTNSPYIRLLPPAYGDGVALPRSPPPARRHSRGVTAYNDTTGYVSSLPAARAVTDAAMGEGVQNETESETNTHMVMQWGQLVDHDIISTSKGAFDCCDDSIKSVPRPESNQLAVSGICAAASRSPSPPPTPSTGSSGGPVWTSPAVTCTAGGGCSAPRWDHSFPARDTAWAEQFNKQTAFLDGSVIYGSSQVGTRPPGPLSSLA
jgi:hypothetical protein